MKKIILYGKKVFLIMLVLAVGMSLCACGGEKKKTEHSGYYIYYIDNDRIELASEGFTPKSKKTTDLIEELLKKLESNGDNGNQRAIPKKVKVNSYDLLDGILTIDFSSEYKELKAQNEVLARAAIVLTLTQIESVDYVAFTINDAPYVRDDGSIVGNMQATDFVDNLGNENNVYSATKFVLYYANEDGSKLKEYDCTEKYYGEKSKEEYIVEKLIQGPEKDGYTATMSQKTELINVITADNICYVNLGENFLSEQSGVSADLVIYSIVNSLSELNYVHKVQICINGQADRTYKGKTLENAFIRNLDYVENDKKIGE